MRIFHLKPLRQLTDEQLMARAKVGNDAAFEELYHHFARRLKGFFFLQLGGDEELAADATHDVFLRAYEARNRYQEGKSVSTWLFTIAYNICRNHYRSNAYETQLSAMLDAEPISEEQIEVQLDAAALDDALAQVLSVVVLGDAILGKPVDENDAKNMLRALSGNTHRVVTGVCITSADKQRKFSVVSEVTFKVLSDTEIDYYVNRYRPFDKAGAYGIQEWIGYVGVTSLKGSYFNVMGLPVQRIYEELIHEFDVVVK